MNTFDIIGPARLAQLADRDPTLYPASDALVQAVRRLRQDNASVSEVGLSVFTSKGSVTVRVNRLYAKDLVLALADDNRVTRITLNDRDVYTTPPVVVGVHHKTLANVLAG